MGHAFIDLFAGIGGIRLGLEATGFRCVFSSEKDAAAAATYRANFGETPAGDILKVGAQDVPDHRLLAAGFPCQPFSRAGLGDGLKDSRGTLFREILRIAEAKGTPALLLENVRNLEHHDAGDTLRTILRELGEAGYTVSWRVLNARDFGVPQNRERIILVADLAGREFDFSALRTGRADTMRAVLQKRGKFEWLDPSGYTLVEQAGPSPAGLVFAGYRNKAIRIAGVRPGTEYLSRVHRQPNRIYDSFGVHPTLSAGESSGRYFILHNGRVRKLTVKECYALMGFPGTFRSIGPRTAQYRQVGNSVCVPMFAEIGREIGRQLLD